MNVEAVVLYLLLNSESRDESLNRYAELKREYFSPAYTAILQAISRFYDRHQKMPTLGELKLETSRSPMLAMSLAALEQLDIPDITDFDLALETLKDQFTQQQFLMLISKALDDIAIRSSTEIMELAGAIPVKLEETVRPNTFLKRANDLVLFKPEEEAAEDVIYSGISNRLDSEYGAFRRGEVVLIGGRRGAGKSVICCNIAKNAVEGTNLVVPYFSIEMSAEETMLRYLGIVSGVEALKIRNKTFDIYDLAKLAEARAEMFSNGKEILRSATILATYEDFVKLDREFVTKGILHEDKGLVIIDDPELKVSALDMYITNLKARFGAKLGGVVVDYVNQVVLDGTSDTTMYDWKNQIAIAKRLKALARKHGIVIFAPYQVDDSGEARMAKGILDSCDFAYLVEAIHSTTEPSKGALKFSGVKARGLPAIDFAVPINWSTLQMSSQDLSPSELLDIAAEPIQEEEEPKRGKKKKGIESNMELI